MWMPLGAAQNKKIIIVKYVFLLNCFCCLLSLFAKYYSLFVCFQPNGWPARRASSNLLLIDTLIILLIIE